MSLQDAQALFSAYQAERSILDDPSLSVFGKAKSLSAIQNAVKHQGEPRPLLSIGDVIKGGIGAGLGYGVSTIVGKFLGVSPSTKSTMQNLGMGLGTILNIGNQWSFQKRSSDMNDTERRLAFRVGFLRGIADAGYFKKTAGVSAVLPLSTETLAGPMNFVTNANSVLADTGGALLGNLAGPDEYDTAAARSDVERQALDRQAKVLEAQRNNQLLASILRKRRQTKASPPNRSLTIPH